MIVVFVLKAYLPEFTDQLNTTSLLNKVSINTQSIVRVFTNLRNHSYITRN